MLLFAIIKYFDVFKVCSRHFGMRSVAQAMVPLILETVELALSGDIVPVTMRQADNQAGEKGLSKSSKFTQAFYNRLRYSKSDAIGTMHCAD